LKFAAGHGVGEASVPEQPLVASDVLKRTTDNTLVRVSDIRPIGIGTGGGDAPGLNAVLRAVVKSAILKHESKSLASPTASTACSGRRRRASSRSKTSAVSCLATALSWAPRIAVIPSSKDPSRNGQETVLDVSEGASADSKKLAIDAVLTVGGDGSQKIALELFHQGMKILVSGCVWNACQLRRSERHLSGRQPKLWSFPVEALSIRLSVSNGNSLSASYSILGKKP